MIEWKATRSHRNNMCDETTIWETNIIIGKEFNEILVCVHRFIGCSNEWFVTSDVLGIHRMLLQSNDIRDAKIEALKYIIKILKQKIEFYSKTIDKINSLL